MYADEIPVGRAKDLRGQRFGNLVPLYRVQNIGTVTAWKCKCDCGNTIIVKLSDLRNNRIQSCDSCSDTKNNTSFDTIEKIDIQYKPTYQTIFNDDDLILDKIIEAVLGEEFDEFSYKEQMADVIAKTFPIWWEDKVRNEQDNLRKTVLQPFLSTCQKCGKTNCKTEIHHIISPKLLGGNEKNNLTILCKECHAKTFKKI